MDSDSVEAVASARRALPDLLAFDYHPDGALTVLDLLAQLRAAIGERPAVVISADRGEAVRAAVSAAGLPLLMKPLKPLALRSLTARLLAARAGLAEA